LKTADREVAAEEHLEVQIRLGGNRAQQRRLILDRVGDEISQAGARHQTRALARFIGPPPVGVTIRHTFCGLLTIDRRRGLYCGTPLGAG
jgi:hypothetical protein